MKKIEWIRVQNKLPRKRQKVLVYGQGISYGSKLTAMRIFISKRTYAEGHFVSVHGYYRLKVTHWRLLPDIPK